MAQQITKVMELHVKIWHHKRYRKMYNISKFVRIVQDSNRIVMYNYHTGSMYWEQIDSPRYSELAGITQENVSAGSELCSLLLAKGFLVTDDVDEYEVLQTDYNHYKKQEIDSTIRLTIFVNEMCNFKCVY